MGGMFLLDNGTGRRFLTKSEICLVKESKMLKKLALSLIDILKNICIFKLWGRFY